MTNVVVIGAGPVGLLQACELRLAGVPVVVLEQRAEPSELPRANGLGGLIVQLLDRRGLLPRLTAGSPFYGPFPGFPFGSVPLRFAGLADNPMLGLMIQQPQLEAVLAERAAELGVEIRRGHELVGLEQDPAGCRLHIFGTQGAYDLYTSFVIGCDGGRSKVRELAGIDFPGSTDREVLRLGHFAGETQLFGTPDGLQLQPGWNRTPRGRVLVTSLRPGVHIVGVRDDVPAEDGPMTLAELQDAVRRVLGRDLSLGDPIWLSRTVSQARIAAKYRDGRVFLAGDAAHLFPAGGSSLNVGLLDAVNLGWKVAAALRGQADLLDTYESERRPAGERALMQTRAQAVLDRVPGDDGVALRQMFGELVEFDEPLRHMAELLNGSDIRYDMPGSDPRVGRFVDVPVDLSAGRPVLLTDRADLRATAERWDVDMSTSDDSILVRPDGYVAWVDGDRPLADDLVHWFGLPSRRLLGQHG
jgi:2-polyprenyl-6-methoxyphenol hydroxylase-like FAD-dependent oxidoreductase